MNDPDQPYLILKATDPQELEALVNDHILAFGYVPIGGLIEGNLEAVDYDGVEVLCKTCMQAVYRRPV